MIELDKKLHKDIKEYCQLNGLIMKDFVNKLLKKAFMVEKYGDKPFNYENGTLVDNEKKQDEIIPEDTPGVIWAPYIPAEMVTVLENLKPADLPPITNEKILEKYRKPIEGMSKEDYSKFYSEIPVDESWEEKLEENIENGSVIMAPYVLDDSGCPMIVVNHSEKEKNDNTRISVTANNENGERVNKTQTTDKSASTEEKEEIKVVRKKKRKLS
jgi:hypothetical protein